jgi:hypothetical protein
LHRQPKSARLHSCLHAWLHAGHGDDGFIDLLLTPTLAPDHCASGANEQACDERDEERECLAMFVGSVGNSFMDQRLINQLRIASES